MSSIEAQIEELCLEAGRIEDGGSRKSFLHSHPHLLSSDTVGGLAEAIRTGVRVDLPKASMLAEAAVAIAQELGDGETLGLALRAKANTLWFRGECREAVRLFDQAAELLERAGNMSEVGRTLSSSIQSRALIGEYDSAFEAAGKARTIFRSLGESLRIARLEINVANILHRQNRFAEALEAYERAYRELLPHKDVEAIGVALHNIAVCLIALDDYDAARAAYQRMRHLCEQNEMPQLVAQADYNIAYLHFLRGEYSTSLEMLRATREICRKTGDHYHLGLCELDASEIYLALGFVQEAADAAESSLEQFRRLQMNYEMARSQLNLAVAVSLQGNANRALDLFEAAHGMARREDNEILPALIDLYSATTLFEQARFEQAQELSRRALGVFEKAALPSKHVACRLLLGRIGLATGDHERALIECGAALEPLRVLDAPVLLYQARFLHGQVLEARGDREGAYAHYQEARSSLETLRSSLQGDELKIGFMRNRVGVYDRLAQLCLERGGGEASDAEVFSYVEAAKSRILQDLLLAGPEPKNAAPEEDASSRRVRELRKALNWYYHLIEREQYSADRISSDRLNELRAKSISYEHQLHRMLLDAPVSGSVGATLKTSRPANVTEVRTALAKNSTLLEYFAIDGKVHAIVLSPESFQIVPVADAAETAQSLRMLQFQLSKFRLNPDYVTRFEAALLQSAQAHLQALYKQLIEPVEELLRTRRLVIVPYGPLHSLPFHAFFDGKDYLVDRFSVSFAPSASIFVNPLRGRESRKQTRSLIFGVDDPRMPSIKREVEAVANVLPNPLVLWAGEATEGALRELGAASRVIHIASHGFFRPDSPMFSAIRLADSYLTLYDLYQMNLPAELLTLSGCVTGLNVVDAGDEAIGLTRGLLYAGAQSLLLSLWEVDDRTTAEFMKIFYTRYATEARKGDAVRSAMIELRDRFPHPYYWAAFKLIGRGLDELRSSS